MTAPMVDRAEATRRYLLARDAFVKAQSKLDRVRGACRQIREGELRVPFADELADVIEKILDEST